MDGLSRAEFLRFSAAGAAALGLSPAAVAEAAKAPRRTLIRGADVLTMAPGGDLKGADVLIDGGKIAAIGKGLKADGALVVPAEGMILMPGMADGHRHLWQAGDIGGLVKTNVASFGRDYQLRKMKMMPCLTAEDHYLCGLVGGLHALDSGVTAVIDHAHGQHTMDRAIASARGVRDSGLGGWFAYQVSHTIDYGPGDTLTLAHATAQRQGPTTDAHWATVDRLMAEVLTDPKGHLRPAIATSAGAVGQPLAVIGEKEFGRARTRGIGLITHHTNPPGRAIPAGHFGHRGCGIRDLHEAGLLGADFHCSHGVTLSDDELALMRGAGVMLCPTCIAEAFPSRPLGRREAALARGRKAGVLTGMGMDVPLALTQDYFEHIRTSFSLMYVGEESEAIANTFSSADMIDYATRAGYAAMRLGDVGGTVETGKRADLLLLDTSRFGFARVGSLADRIVNFAARSDIDSVWAGGRLVKSGGAMVGVDWKALNARVAAMQARVQAQMATITFT